MLKQKTYCKRIKTAIKTIFKSNIFASLVIMAFLLYAISSKPSMAENKTCVLNEEKLNILKESRTGDFNNIIIANDPFYAGDLAFKDANGKDLTIADFKGKTVFLNLWATWCVPCRDEMPDISMLQEKKADDSFAVIAVNIEKQDDSYVLNFLKEIKADNLNFYQDKSMAIFHKLRREGLAFGLPATLIIDKNGCLTSSLVGSAPWGNEDAMQFIDTVKNLDAK